MEQGTAAQVVDVDGSNVVVWGEDEESVRYVGTVLERIEQAGTRASAAGDYARDHREFMADLRGAATLLGLVIPADGDVVAFLRPYLLASRDHEGETAERIIQAGRGQGEANAKAARLQAMQYSGRRGVLDGAVYWIDRGLRGLAQIREWEQLAAKLER